MNEKTHLKSKNKSTISNYKNPDFYINRELSWLEFNKRVLEEAEDSTTPNMEKLKFLSIFSSNLDEFYMIRVGGLARLQEAEIEDRDISGRTTREQLYEISQKAQPYVEQQYKCLNTTVIPALKEMNIRILDPGHLKKSEMDRLEEYFLNNVFPVLTPLAVDAGHPFPFLGNLRLNLMVVFEDDVSNVNLQAYAFVEAPSILPRLIPVNEDEPGFDFILLEDLIRKHVGYLFPGMTIQHCRPFRVTRNLDYDLHESDVMNLLQSVEAELKDRSNQIAVRLEIQDKTPEDMIQCLVTHLNLESYHVFRVNGPINLCGLMPIYDLDVDSCHRDKPFNPRIPKRFAAQKDIFSIIKDGDILLHHPFDSFAVVVEFLNTAAEDPNVLAIKQTLYRTGKNSPIIAALRRAVNNGKQVTAVVEVKARFDEQSNIEWSKKMEETGINLVFGFVKWKTHCKACLVVRKEGDKLVRYVHVGTGNYNSITAKLYTDIGIMTADKTIAQDVSSLFNVITGFNSWTGGEMFYPETVLSMFKKIKISPVNMQSHILEMIQHEIKLSTQSKPGRIIAKMNALVDRKTIETLYQASQSGVKVDLIVRGICCLRPGIPGLSENIRVISILDRFLEHTRIYYFHNGGNPKIYSGSADWMPRNFKRRVEILYPIENKELKTRIIDEILMVYLNDNVKARIEMPDGSYQRVIKEKGDKSIRSQDKLIAIARKGGLKSPLYEDLVKEIGKSGFKTRFSRKQKGSNS